MSEAVIGFAGVVIGSLAIIVYQVVTERRKIKRKARYLAVRLSCLLEEYIDECDAVLENADYNLQLDDETIHYGLGSFDVSMPTGSLFPDDLDWTSIDMRFAYDAFMLANKTVIYNRNVQTIREHIDDPFDFGQEYIARKEHCQELQALAHSLVDRIRARWDLPHTRPISTAMR